MTTQRLTHSWPCSQNQSASCSSVRSCVYIYCLVSSTFVMLLGASKWLLQPIMVFTNFHSFTRIRTVDFITRIRVKAACNRPPACVVPCLWTRYECAREKRSTWNRHSTTGKLKPLQSRCVFSSLQCFFIYCYGWPFCWKFSRACHIGASVPKNNFWFTVQRARVTNGPVAVLDFEILICKIYAVYCCSMQALCKLYGVYKLCAV